MKVVKGFYKIFSTVTWDWDILFFKIQKSPLELSGAPENDHERVEKILEVPAQFSALPWQEGKLVVMVTGAKQLHSHDGEDEDDDGEHKAQVSQSSHGPADDADQEVQGGPRLGQLEDSQLPVVGVVESCEDVLDCFLVQVIKISIFF